MKTFVGILAHAILGVVLGSLFLHCAPGAAPAVRSAAAQTKHYVCPTCGHECDKAVYDHPGTCPVCGMELVEQGTEKPPGKAVAILLFDHAEIIDFSGPYEVFGAAGFDVYTVAATKDAVTTAMGMKVVPKYTFADAPQPAVLVVPGGGVREARGDAATLTWVRRASARAEQTMSVCNGAFILASAGLLDGLGATTTYHLLSQLTAEFPRTKVVRDQRFVDNGKIITTAGLSSGIDGALHVVEKMLGKGTAQSTALGLEYDWHQDAPFVRAALADHVIPELDLDSLGKWTLESTAGTTDRWAMTVRGTASVSGPELLSSITQALAKNGKWRVVASSPTSSEYRFEDEDRKPWTGSLTIDPVRPEARDYALKLSVARGG